MEIDSTQTSLKWSEIWRIVFLRPTIKTFSRIINDPKASTKWGVTWMAIIAFIFWFVGPKRAILWGIAADQFGLQRASYFVVIGAIVAPILGVSALLINAAIAHGLARLFSGAGTFYQLVYCWGVMQLPFILLSGLVINIPSIIPSSHEFTFSTAGMIIQITTLLITIGIILYLFYAEAVAFSAVEKFGVGKGFGILILLGVAVGVVGSCLSYGFQSLSTIFFHY